MLSYLHAFHAGNFADVHKHTALCLLIRHLLGKPAPFCVIETHAGRGLYDLTSAEAEKTGEWRAGIGRLIEADPQSDGLRVYLDTATGGKVGPLADYPGSPAIAARMLRSDDRLVLMELHPAEHKALRAAFKHDKRGHVHRRDGFEGLPALVPPAERRGLVLIDPSYEVKSDYRTVPRRLGQAIKRWPTGIYAVWYPLLPDARHRQMVADIDGLGSETLHATLEGPPAGRGMTGSGLAVINPPYGFADAFAAAGDEMAGILFPGTKARHGMTEPA